MMTENDDKNKKNLLICCSGSVATIKVPLMVNELMHHFNLRLVLTKFSKKFLDLNEINCPIYEDEDEWNSFDKVGDSILHIELRRWAQIIILSPCSANTLAKLSNGICDNLLTCILRALDSETPVHIYPAMNTHMYNHPLTQPQLNTLKTVLNYNIHGPIQKNLACGDTGIGAMVDYKDIIDYLISNCK